MPSRDVIQFRSGEGVRVVGRPDYGSSGATEDWTSRKRVETKTTKNVERRIQRQVVLEDGRVIEEDVPQVTVDTLEDTQSHDEDGQDEVKHFGDDFGGVVPAERNMWYSSGTVLREKDTRNTSTKQVDSRTCTTASATNLGDISSRDVDKVVKHGKRTRDFVKSYHDHDDTSSSNTMDLVHIPAKVIHSGKSASKIVDREDAKEISRLQDGKVKTERFVTREVTQDKEEETPDDDDSVEEAESRDGDRDEFSQKKEERFVDYYRVPKGKSIKDGKFVGHGLHMTSYDKSDQRGAGQGTRRPALTHGGAAAKSDRWHSRPPRGSRDSRHASFARRTYRSGTPARTWESDHVRASHSPNHDSRSHRRRSSYFSDQSDDPSPLRSPDRYHHRSMTTLRTDLDEERAGRLKRVMSFTDARNKPDTPKNHRLGFLDSMRSLYATVTRKKAGKGDAGSKNGQPVRPPRKNKSKSISSVGSGSIQSLDWHKKSAKPNETNTKSINVNKWQMYPPPRLSSHARTTPALPYVTTSLPRPPRSKRFHDELQPLKSKSPSSSSIIVTAAAPAVSRHRGRSLSTSRHDDSSSDNREPPRFEPERHRDRSTSSRYFGQVDDEEVDSRIRPPPDMRRLLLHNVNLSRSKSMNRGLDTSRTHFLTAE